MASRQGCSLERRAVLNGAEPGRPGSGGSASEPTHAYAEDVEGSGVGHTGSGHLDLDDVGLVETGAQEGDGRLGAGAGEVLEGPQGPTWGERLDSSGIPSFLRRHRRLSYLSVLLLGAVVVTAGVVVVCQGSRPPADDQVVAVRVWDSSSTATVDPSAPDQGVLTFSYTLDPQRSGDSLRLLGLVGPGVRANSAWQRASSVPGDSVAHDLAVIPDCDDPEAVGATEADYRLRVERTDALGRTAVGLVNLPSGSSIQWAVLIGRSCVEQWFDDGITTRGFDVTTVTTPTGDRSVRLGLHLRNALPTAVDVAKWNRNGGVSSSEVAGTLPPGATTVLPVTLRVDDCRRPELVRAEDRYLVLLTGVLVRKPSPQAGWPEPVAGFLPVTPTPEFRDRVNAAARSVCAGMPPVTVTVVSVAPTEDPALSLPLIQNGESIGVLRVRLRIVSTAERVTVADTVDATDANNGWPRSLTTATAVLHRGATEVDIHWAARCDAPDTPPFVALTLVTHGRSFPAQAQLLDQSLLAGYRRACPNLSSTDLPDQGWPTAR